MRLSAKYGLNPTLSTCFWCGKETGEVALLGAAYPKEAPMHMVTSYEPCVECQKLMAQGITCIEANPTPASPDQPPLQDRVYPTGTWSVVTKEGFARAFGGAEAKRALAKCKCFLDSETWDLVGLPRRNIELLKE